MGGFSSSFFFGKVVVVLGNGNECMDIINIKYVLGYGIAAAFFWGGGGGGGGGKGEELLFFRFFLRSFLRKEKKGVSSRASNFFNN